MAGSGNTGNPGRDKNVKSRQNKADFMVDIAAERVYKSQDRGYYEAYTRWRNNPENKCGYGFRHDIREHVYIDGEGYADEHAVTVEKQTLSNCLKVLGAAMLILFVFQIAMYIFMTLLFDTAYYGWVRYSQKDKLREPSDMQAVVFCLIRLAAYLTAIGYCAIKLKLPARVAMPMARFKPWILALGTSMLLVYAVISRIFNFLLMRLQLSLGIDIFFYKNISSDSAPVQVFYLITELLLIPVLTEIFYRGYLMQLFRQFGDYFAIFITSLAGAYFFHDISKAMYVFFLSVILGMIVINTGNIHSAMAARVIVVSFSYLMNEFSSRSGNIGMRFWEIFSCLIVICICYFISANLKNRVRRGAYHDGTELTIVEKLKLILYSNILIIWMVLTMVSTILMVRFI